MFYQQEELDVQLKQTSYDYVHIDRYIDILEQTKSRERLSRRLL